MEEKIDGSKKVSELTAGELYAIIYSAIQNVLSDRKTSENNAILGFTKPLT